MIKERCVMNYCPHCGAKIEHDGKFCQTCGEPLEVTASETKHSFSDSFSQLKRLIPSRTNFNRVIGFMHANFFLIHAVYLFVFIVTLLSPMVGLIAFVFSAVGIYLTGALHSGKEVDLNKRVKEVVTAVGENREVATKKDVVQSVSTPDVSDEDVNVVPPVSDTFDELDIAASVLPADEVETLVDLDQSYDSELEGDLVDETPETFDVVVEEALVEATEAQSDATQSDATQSDEAIEEIPAGTYEEDKHKTILAPTDEAEVVLDSEHLDVTEDA